MRVAGIDPGLSGAIGILEERRYVRVTDMPTMLRSKTTGKEEVDAATLAEILRSAAVDLVVLERVQASPTYDPRAKHVCGACKRPMGGMSPTSAFNFGDSFAQVKAVVRILKLELVLISPRGWKGKAGLTGAEKEDSRALAISLWPMAASELARKMDDNRAEALLIGLYGGFTGGTEVPAPGKSRRRKPVEDQLQLT